MKKKEFLNYINSFRGIAILYIVFGHCISAFDWSNDMSVRNAMVLSFTNGTVLFVFIAGYLFQYLSYKYKYGNYMKSKLFNVGMPYLIMSIPGILYYTLVAQRPGMEYLNDWPWILRVIQFYLVGAQLVPFWFIPMIFIHYILSPVYIVGDRNNYLYYCLPAFFILSLFVWRGGPYQLQSYLHYAFVYFFGMFACKFRERLNPYLVQGKTILGLGCIILMLIWVELHFGPGTISAKRVNFLERSLLCLFYLGVLSRYDYIIGKKFDLFASLSFGIFFVHSYLISGIKRIQVEWVGDLWGGSIPGLLVFMTAIVLLSMGFVLSVKKVAGRHSRKICGS